MKDKLPEFKSKPVIGLDDLGDEKYSLGRLTMIENGKNAVKSGQLKSICRRGGLKAGHDKSNEEIEKLWKSSIKKTSTKILVFNYKTKEFIGEFPSQNEAARQLKPLNSSKKVDVGNINCVLKGKQNSTCGYTFKYKNSDS